jgi:hypothetical protein
MFDDSDANLRYIDVAPDGRFLAVEAAPTSSTASIVLAQHWAEEVGRLVPRSSP